MSVSVAEFDEELRSKLSKLLYTGVWREYFQEKPRLKVPLVTDPAGFEIVPGSKVALVYEVLDVSPDCLVTRLVHPYDGHPIASDVKTAINFEVCKVL